MSNRSLRDLSHVLKTHDDDESDFILSDETAQHASTASFSDLFTRLQVLQQQLTDIARARDDQTKGKGAIV